MATPSPKNLESVRLLADKYTDELTAQFRTLNLFVGHAGEVGRAHEVFLRGVIQRFLPGKLRCGSGFVASADHVTRQQDIIVFDAHVLPLLLEVGDCLVVDAEAVAATIEVKTRIDSVKSFAEAFSKLVDLKLPNAPHPFVGLHAWEGLSLELALDCYWEFIRKGLSPSLGRLPDAVYVRGRYLIVPNWDGRLETPPLLVFDTTAPAWSEGAALLSFIERMWIGGLQNHPRWPWWKARGGTLCPPVFAGCRGHRISRSASTPSSPHWQRRRTRNDASSISGNRLLR
jgi:hypothetical protein